MRDLGESPKIIFHVHFITFPYRISDKTLQRRDRTLELNQYDESTLARLLDFCYRRTYSDGEYVEGVAPLLTSMTINDVHDALRAPFDALSYMDDPRLRGICTQCEYFTEEGDEGDSQEEWEDGTLPDRSSSDGYCDSSDDEVSPGVPRSPHGVSLLVNFKVYIAAKELQIPALELVAQNRFAHTLRSHYAGFGDLPSLIEEVYLRTDSSDHLRALICQTVAAEYNKEDEVILKAEMREVMARNGEVATDVLDAVLRLRSEEEDMG